MQPVDPESKPQEPFRRDFLVEAIQIAEGGNYKVIKREHVRALFDAYMNVTKRHSELKNQLLNIAQQAVKLRAAQGKPPLAPVPPEKPQ